MTFVLARAELSKGPLAFGCSARHLQHLPRSWVPSFVSKRVYVADKMHRVLPIWKGCIALSSTEYFALGRHRNSFDSRYFGPIERKQIEPLIIFVGIDNQLIVN
jgi:Signal peptidase, peptidase S26